MHVFYDVYFQHVYCMNFIESNCTGKYGNIVSSYRIKQMIQVEMFFLDHPISSCTLHYFVNNICFALICKYFHFKLYNFHDKFWSYYLLKSRKYIKNFNL